MSSRKERMKKYRRRRRKNRPAVRMLLITGGVILALVLLTALGAWALFEHYYSKLGQAQTVEPTPQSTAAVITPVPSTPSPEDSAADEIAALEAQLLENFEKNAQALDFDDEDVYHILLIGCDASDGGVSRSDSIMVVSINRSGRTITVTSLMRDIYLTIPDHWNDRINAAYAYGGAELLMRTIQSNLGIPVQEYVMVDFESFREVVDLLGGVTVDLSDAEREAINAQVWETESDRLDESQTGLVHLNGNQALAYARQRSVGASDFDRTARQREVIGALFDEVKQLGLLELNELVNAVLPHVVTNLTQGQIFDILLHALDYLSYDMQTLRIPADGTYDSLMISGKSVLGIDFESNRELWLDTVYGPEETAALD